MDILSFQKIPEKEKRHSVPLQGTSLLFIHINPLHFYKSMSLKIFYNRGVSAGRIISANTFDINQLIIFLIL